MNYPSTAFSAQFPRSVLYPFCDPAADRVSEAAHRAPAFGYTERHIQCVWFDASLRPPTLQTTDGDTVTIEHAGTWNLEAGPDFLRTRLRLDPGGRRLQGDVEVHTHPSGWKSHGHHDDPRYARVCAHVTWHPGSIDKALLPPGTIQIVLCDQVTRHGFSFESIDTAAYPYANRADLPPCQMLLAGWSPDKKGDLLDAAGEERLRRKAARLEQDLARATPDQVLYREVMTALGYKQNKLAFRTLAERAPVEALREVTQKEPLATYAVLLGTAGLLPTDMKPQWDDDTRDFIPALWDAWWKTKERWDNHVLPAESWTLSGLRPTNHPVRRMAGAVQLFMRPEPLSQLLHEAIRGAPEEVVARLLHIITSVSDPYWSHRLSWSRPPTKRTVALIGRSRAISILINVFIPYLAATGADASLLHRLLNGVPIEEDNGIVKQTAHYLFGVDHPYTWYHTGLRRQGLVQVFHDFCLSDRSRCAACRFPELLKRK